MIFSSLIAGLVSVALFVASQSYEHSVVVPNLVSTGVMIPDTPVPTATPTAVPPTPTPEPQQSWNCTGNWQVDRWGPLVASVFPEWAVCDALFVISVESEGNPNVYNFTGSGACGLFQLLPCESTDPYLNTLGAYRKWLDGGQDFWKHWRRWW